MQFWIDWSLLSFLFLFSSDFGSNLTFCLSLHFPLFLRYIFSFLSLFLLFYFDDHGFKLCPLEKGRKHNIWYRIELYSWIKMDLLFLFLSFLLLFIFNDHSFIHWPLGVSFRRLFIAEFVLYVLLEIQGYILIICKHTVCPGSSDPT